MCAEYIYKYTHACMYIFKKQILRLYIYIYYKYNIYTCIKCVYIIQKLILDEINRLTAHKKTKI